MLGEPSDATSSGLSPANDGQEAGDFDEGATTVDAEPRDVDGDERPVSIVDDLFDWLQSERSSGFKVFVAAVPIVAFVLCLVNAVWSDVYEAVTDLAVLTERFVEDELTPVQTTIGASLLVVFVAYRIWFKAQERRGIKPVPWMTILLAVVVALSFTAAATWLMFREAASASPDASAQLRFDAVKTAITLFAGTAGAGVLLLSFRSHFTSEADRINSQFDAAADKLSQDSDVIQVAGLLAVERIARKHRSYRPAAVALILAYYGSQEARNRAVAERILRELG